MTKIRILPEPLFHFFILGAVLFVLYGWLNGNSERPTDEIVIDQIRLNSIRSTFEKTWQRPATEDEMQNLIDAWVREEVLYREGMLIGFDRDDQIIRRRIAQKMSFIADGLAPAVPDETELSLWFVANRDDYKISPVLTFRQVYFDPSRHADQLDRVLDDARAALATGDESKLPGDATMLPESLELAPTTEIARLFGKDFAIALEDMEVGEWQGPVRSGYGLHYVQLEERIEGRAPTLDEVRPAIERDFLGQRSREINEAFYESLRERYTIRVEAGPAS
jgi:hypothetical protein